MKIVALFGPRKTSDSIIKGFPLYYKRFMSIHKVLHNTRKILSLSEITRIKPVFSSTIGGGMTPPSLDICHVMVFCTCVKTEKNQNKERKKERKKESISFLANTFCL